MSDPESPDGGHGAETALAVAIGTWRFPARGHQVKVARLAVRQALRDHPQYDAELVVLLLSELVTNAVHHSRSAWVWVALARTASGRLRVRVTDAGGARTIPHVPPREVDDEGGRGLRLVGHLSERWRIEPGLGRVSVWFEIAEGQTMPDEVWPDVAELLAEAAALKASGGGYVG